MAHMWQGSAEQGNARAALSNRVARRAAKSRARAVAHRARIDAARRAAETRAEEGATVRRPACLAARLAAAVLRDTDTDGAPRTVCRTPVVVAWATIMGAVNTPHQRARLAAVAAWLASKGGNAR